MFFCLFCFVFCFVRVFCNPDINAVYNHIKGRKDELSCILPVSAKQKRKSHLSQTLRTPLPFVKTCTEDSLQHQKVCVSSLLVGITGQKECSPHSCLCWGPAAGKPQPTCGDLCSFSRNNLLTIPHVIGARFFQDNQSS